MGGDQGNRPGGMGGAEFPEGQGPSDLPLQGWGVGSPFPRGGQAGNRGEDFPHLFPLLLTATKRKEGFPQLFPHWG